MPRPTLIANTYIENLENSFTRQVYEGAVLRARGVVNPVEYNPNFPIFQTALTDNQQYNTLSDLERDSIIDYLLR